MQQRISQSSNPNERIFVRLRSHPKSYSNHSLEALIMIIMQRTTHGHGRKEPHCRRLLSKRRTRARERGSHPLTGFKKFNFPQGSLKNAAHQTSELWKAALTKGLIPERYVLKVNFWGIEIFQKPYHKLKSIEIWPRYRAKTFLGLSNFETSHTHRIDCTLNEGLEFIAPRSQRFQGSPVVKYAWILGHDSLLESPRKSL